MTFGGVVVMVLGCLAVFCLAYWAALGDSHQNPEAVIQVIAGSGSWKFVYPGSDGEFGTADDRVSKGTLLLPRDRSVRLELSTADRLHELSIPGAPARMAAIPGRPTPLFLLWNTRECEWRCTEPSCPERGTERGPVVVMPEAEFRRQVERLGPR